MLVNAYAAEVEQRIGWDFEDETPGNDARGFAREGSLPPMVETHLANTVLTNGARFYVDHAHPEYSTPRVPRPPGGPRLRQGRRGGAPALHAGRRRCASPTSRTGRLQEQLRRQGQLLRLPRELHDGPGRALRQVVAGVVPHFVTRQIFAGAGKVGRETAALDSGTVDFQISQRAEFFEEVVGLETTLKRPIVNTRDEPHADPQRFRRLHVIVGDANLSEFATFLKLGTTALVLAMIEDEALPEPRSVPVGPRARPAPGLGRLDPRRPLSLTDGTTATALEIQWELFGAARKYAEERPDGPG